MDEQRFACERMRTPRVYAASGAKPARRSEESTMIRGRYLKEQSIRNQDKPARSDISEERSIDIDRHCEPFDKRERSGWQ